LRRSHSLFIALVVAVAAAVAAVPAMAGDYHSGASLICSDCHTMHFSLAHGYDGGTPDTLGSGPNPRLLKAPVDELCLTCHDGSAAAPDVLEFNTGTHVREAGALNEIGSSAPYEEYKGHTLGFDMDAVPPPGFSATPPTNGWGTLDCTSCHSAHGGTSTSNTDVGGHTGFSPWRNLSRRAGSGGNNTVSYAAVTNDPTMDVYEVSNTLGNIPTHYSIDNVSLNEPDTTRSGMGEWCKKCHTDFHGSSASANMNDGTDWLRHPTADADLGTNSRWTSLTNHVKVMNDPAAVDDTTATPTCISCHKGHGNQNPFGLIYMVGTGASVTEEGDGGTGMRDLCRQCHSQGG
jgi:hypothetical protein